MPKKSGKRTKKGKDCASKNYGFGNKLTFEEEMALLDSTIAENKARTIIAKTDTVAEDGMVDTDAYKQLQLKEEKTAELRQKMQRKIKAKQLRSGRRAIPKDMDYSLAGEADGMDLSALAGNSKQAQRALAMMGEVGMAETMEAMEVQKHGGIAGVAKRAKDKNTAKALNRTGVSAGAISSLSDALEARKGHDKRKVQREKERAKRKELKVTKAEHKKKVLDSIEEKETSTTTADEEKTVDVVDTAMATMLDIDDDDSD